LFSRRNVATILVQRGTLRPGDFIIAGTTYTRVRTILNERREVIKEALPSMPVIVDGWREVPNAGDVVIQAPTEEMIKDAIAVRELAIHEAKKNATNSFVPFFFVLRTPFILHSTAQ